MAYDRYDSRRDGREGQPRWRDDDRSGRGWNDRDDGNDRGFFERAGDQIASWFGDDAGRRGRDDNDRTRGSGGGWGGNDRPNAQRFRERGDDRREWFGGGQSWGAGRDAERDYGDRSQRGSGESGGFGSAFMGDEDFDRYERRPRWRDEGYRRPYTGRSAGSQDMGRERDRGQQPYRPMAGDYGRGGDRLERGASFYGVGAPHDRHYGQLRQRHLDELDRDYEDYARENRSRFEDDFSSWRQRRQEKRGLLGQIREHMEVVGSDGEHVGTVDRTAGDRLILTKSDAESGGAHHSLMCTMIDRVEGDKVMLGMTADEAKRQWRDENRDRALFEREDQGEAGPGMLNRSFSGTY